jgi:hypothetical protein
MKSNKNFIISLLLFVILIFILILVFLPTKRENFHLDGNIDSSNKYTAIIIEPRRHEALEYVLRNFLDNLDDDWNVILFHGNLNKEFSENIIYNNLNEYKHRTSLVNLKIDNLTIPEYSSIFLSKEFYNSIPTEVFLVFQTDAIICSKFKHFIYDFIKYDYVGAPLGDGIVGNGGLSLRRKSKMLEILDKCKNLDGIQQSYEDVLFSIPCEEVTDYNKPSTEEAKNFSIEKILNDKSFGLHKAYKYHGTETIKQWCPEIEKLALLQ